MSNLNEPFDPKKTTLKDYLIYLIEKVDRLETEQKDMTKEITELKIDMQKRNVLQESKEKRHAGIIAIAGVAGGLITWLIQFLYESK